MGFQTKINAKQPYGVVGEFHDTSVKRVTAYELAEAVTIGNPAFRVAADGKATGTYAANTAAEFIGIFVSPKEYIIDKASLEPTMQIPAGSVAQVASIGHVNVKVGVAVKAGDSAYWNGTAWVKTAPSSGVTAALGKFICDGASGETVTVAIDTLA